VPDFGHELRFATFPTPTSEPAPSAVQLAKLSEQWGYDLVMFQDHPYRPNHLDVWTLIAWVAAQTTRIHVAPNVLNMATRAPVTVAKSVASLDLLSGGRVELGLGTGLLWDQVVAMGFPRRTRAEAIAALSDAIDVSRASWSADGHPARDGGAYHNVEGMQPGPAPAHDVPIWLGAYKPRMLRLLGQKADGWAAMLGRIQSRAQWQSASTTIDQAAVEAGRDPVEIRRMAGIAGTFTGVGGGYLHGPATQWVAQLLPSVVEDGVSTFIVVSDDPATLRQFADEVIPALREAVGFERRHSARVDVS
jgi:alkanesulfonate monooxygenase SsuD/methylene tetrahydromethanopterin reductase-like flavin-dependent oxidoreductase (luciferase family)